MKKRILFTRLSDIAKLDNKGFALLSVAILLGVITASAAALISYSLVNRNAGKILETDYDSIQIAEAGIQKARYCLKQTDGTNCGGSYGESYAGESGVSFGSGSFTVEVIPGDECDNGSGGSGSGGFRCCGDDHSGSGGSDGAVLCSSLTENHRVIISQGTAGSGHASTLRMITFIGMENFPGTHFDYALQSGDGGMILKNNAKVKDGSVHSNSDIECGGNMEIEMDVYISASGGKIDGCEVKGDAHADRILDSEIDGDAYYRTDPDDIAGTTVVGTRFPDSPTPDSIALPDIDLPLWREMASAGGTISGNYEPANNERIGPVKIDGDLHLGNSVGIVVTGPIWVTGNITTDNAARFELDDSFEAYSTVILADNPGDISNGGKIILNNNSEVDGTGTDGSYLVFVSTNDSLDDTDPAIEISNNAGGAIFLALNGLAYFSNNANAAAIAGKSIYLKNNAIIDYDDSGATTADLILSNGVEDWFQTEDSWQEL